MSRPTKEHDLCQTARAALAHSVIHALHQLEVEQNGQQLVISGRVDSYYYKQMAQETIRAVLPATRMVNTVVVSDSPQP